MRIMYLDCFSGISGDMFLGASIDAGLDKELLIRLPKQLNLPQVKIEISNKVKTGLSATKVDIIYPKEHEHRHLSDIEKIIDAGDISDSVKILAKKIFRRLAEAEAEMHGITVEKVHFHEVGALDAIIDITGAALAYKTLKIDKVFASAISVGGGMVKMAHGLYPVPAPATAYLLSGFTVKHGPVDKELVTPTGAAILSVFTENSDDETPNYKIESVGYGAGTADFEIMPNVLRLTLGIIEEAYDFDKTSQLDFNVDDMNPQLMPYLIEKVMDAGAVDAYVTPIVMKKGRPGHLFTVALPEIAEQRVLDVIFSESTTIGVRKTKTIRTKLKRKSYTVNTSFGEVLVKEIIRPAGNNYILPEYEECKRIAKKTKKPLKEVQQKLICELSINKK